MKHFFKTVLIVICGLMMVTVAQAGFEPSPSDSVESFIIENIDCDGVELSFDEGDVFSETRVNIDLDPSPSIDFNPSFYEEIFLGESRLADTAFFEFDSTVTGIITLNATIEIRFGGGGDFPDAEDSVSFELDCTTGTPTVTITSTDRIIGCNDGRLNQTLCEPIAMYSVNSDDGVGLDIWEIDRDSSIGTPSLYLSAETLEAAFTAGTDNFCTIAISSDGRTGVYLSSDGSMQVVNGPDFEDKYFVFDYAVYPSTPTYDTYFGGGLPIAPSC